MSYLKNKKITVDEKINITSGDDILSKYKIESSITVKDAIFLLENENSNSLNQAIFTHFNITLDKDKETLAVLRMIKTAVQAAEIDKKEELNAEEELTILAREAKQRRESLAEFVKAGRDELVAKTEAEIEIVERYLPKQLSVEEVKEVIATVAEKIGATTQKEFGKLMGAVMQELKGKADGNVIKEQVKAHLG